MVARTKRKYNNARRKTAKRYGVTVKRASVAASALQAAVRRTLFKNAETKNSQYSGSDYQQIGHNNFIIIAPNNLLTTSQGFTDPENANIANRIGDQITLSKIDFRMMIELNERFSDVTYRIILVKSAKGDVPTNANLFVGLSGNKMLDNLNRERFTILYQKWGKIINKGQSGGRAAAEDVTATALATGMYTSGSPNFLFSRATKLIKFSLPGTKFAKNGIIQYEAGNSPQQKFFDYNLLVYAYSNFSTSEAISYNVLAVNDYFHRLSYKDM